MLISAVTAVRAHKREPDEVRDLGEGFFQEINFYLNSKDE